MLKSGLLLVRTNKLNKSGRHKLCVTQLIQHEQKKTHHIPISTCNHKIGDTSCIFSTLLFLCRSFNSNEKSDIFINMLNSNELEHRIRTLHNVELNLAIFHTQQQQSPAAIFKEKFFFLFQTHLVWSIQFKYFLFYYA